MIRDQVVELPNRSKTPTESFEVRVDDIGEALADAGIMMTDRDWPELVIWHTHPSGFVGPSRFDMQHRVPELRRHLVVALHEDDVTPTFY